MPVTTKPMTQLSSAMRSGQSPLTRAPTSVSAEARVARPKRVKRNNDGQHNAESDDRAGEQQAVRRDADTEEALTWFCGKIGLTRTTCVPTW